MTTDLRSARDALTAAMSNIDIMLRLISSVERLR
jgi:hypothetical protein